MTDADCEKAAGEPVHNPVHSDAVAAIQEPAPEKESAVSPALASDTAVLVHPTGDELASNRAEKTRNRMTGDANSDATGREVDPALREITSVWPGPYRG